MKFSFAPFRLGQRRGSVLIPTLYVIVFSSMLLAAILPLALAGYGAARADRDRSAALAAAEAGLNWEIARINNRLWNRDDSGNLVVDGSGNPAQDYWPDSTSTPPSNASTRSLLTDSSGQWTQRFLVGVSADPYSVGAGGSFVVTSEGQVRAADGNIVRRRVQIGGAGLFSLFDSAAIFAFSTASGGSSAWSIGGSCSVVGGCGSNGQIAGNGGPIITVGPLGLWGSSASVTGVTTTGISVVTRPSLFATDTADQAANLLRTGTTTGSGVAGWRPTGYDADGNTIGPTDQFGRAVNSQAEIATSTGAFYRSVSADEFLDNRDEPVLASHIQDFNGGMKLRLKPGVYYFARINLGNNDVVEIANDTYKADGTVLYDAGHNAINGPATVADYNSERNRITIFVDAITTTGNGSNPYLDSGIGSGLYTALQGAKSETNALRYRRPGNFRIYAKNTGGFSVGGSSNSPVEFNANLLHYNQNSSGGYYGAITLNSGCHLYGGLFGWTVEMSGGAIVEQYGSGVFTGNDPVIVSPGGSGSGGGGGTGGGFGGWQWQEIPSS